MNLIQFNIQGALTGTNLFDPDAAGVVRTIQDGRIVFNTSPAVTFGRVDFASLLGFDDRPMIALVGSLSNTAGPVNGAVGIVGPTAPGGTARGTQLVILVAASGVRQNPVIIPSQHLVQISADNPPITFVAAVSQLKSGDIVNEITRGLLTP